MRYSEKPEWQTSTKQVPSAGHNCAETALVGGYIGIGEESIECVYTGELVR